MTLDWDFCRRFASRLPHIEKRVARDVENDPIQIVCEMKEYALWQKAARFLLYNNSSYAELPTMTLGFVYKYGRLPKDDDVLVLECASVDQPKRDELGFLRIDCRLRLKDSGERE